MGNRDRPTGTGSEPSIGERRRRRLQAARLYMILETEPAGRPAADVVAPALAGGVDMVQLREKVAGEEVVVAAARSLGDLCHRHGALLIVNDRPEIVLDCGADGVHVGQDDVSVDEARAVLGADALVGVSTHSPAQIAAAGESTADYLSVGPVFATPTKPDAEPVGPELVRHAAEHVRKPFFAIGGIDAGNAEAVVAAGARRLAVVRAIRDAEDPDTAAEALRAALPMEVGAGAER